MDDKLREILDFAIEKENGAERFYLHWAERVEDGDVRRLLLEMADDERKHGERLAAAEPAELVGQTPPSPDFKIAELLAEAEPAEEMTLADALTLAIQREERAIALYDRLRAHASPSGTALFSALADDERRHKHHLELRYATLTRRGRA
jgi:rubrerythrin